MAKRRKKRKQPKRKYERRVWADALKILKEYERAEYGYKWKVLHKYGASYSNIQSWRERL